ncbi:MAG: CBS domain-containing protein [Leptolyngbyaceae cyanobacterium MO_188.B28]|nr:CBS domain-containing protein [Leptolyngbyaceae cyanobacterium MO_188.B28]
MQLPRFILDSFPLEHVIDRHPLTVTPDMFLMDVIALMSQTISSHLDNPKTLSNFYNRGRTSCALVMDGSQLKGIFTERDTVALAASQQTLDDIRVGNVMTSQVITLPIEKFSDVHTALTLLRQHHIRHLPIVQERGQLLGLITFTTLGHAVHPSPLQRIWRVGDVMTSKVVHASPTASLLQLSQLMRQHSVSCVVITQDQEKEAANSNREKWGDETSPFCLAPIGIVTERDIVQFKALGFDFHELQAHVVMSTPLFLMKPEDTLWDAHQNMRKRQLRRLVVADRQGNLKGVITESSLLKTLNSMSLNH